MWKNRIIGHESHEAGWFVANPKNWRIHPAAQGEAVEGALESVGWVRSVLVNQRTGYILDGHLRITLALRQGEDTIVPVEIVDLSEEEEALVLAHLDSVVPMAGRDAEKLGALLAQCATSKELPENEKIDEFLKTLATQMPSAKPTGEDPGAQIDKADELREKWGVETGQMWRLGEHRLICGDCTDRAVVERVMGGEKARLCFTSPPYADARNYELGEFDYMALYKSFSEIALSICGDVLVNLGLLHKDGAVFRYWDEWLNYCESIGYKLFGWYVWDQLSGMPGDYRGRLARSHEWVFHFSNTREQANKWIETTGESEKRGTSGKRFRQKDGSLRELTSPDKVGQPYKIPDSVIRVRREMARGIHTETHPAVFPIEFVEFGINTWSNRNDIIYEPFSGSGTTLIACERLSRKCRAVAIQRWVDMTGGEPKILTP